MLDAEQRFADRLRSAMLTAEIRPAQLAKLAKVTPGTVSRWRKGSLIPDDLRMAKVAMALKVREAWLRSGTLPREAGQEVEEDAAAIRALGERIATLADACASDLRDQAENGLVSLEVAESFLRLIAREGRQGRQRGAVAKSSSS